MDVSDTKARNIVCLPISVDGTYFLPVIVMIDKVTENSAKLQWKYQVRQRSHLI